MPIEFGDGPVVCRWTGEHEALEHFATYIGKTQSQQHIKPLHWYAACRLVLEGGFLPEEITPRPPFTARRGRRGYILDYTPELARGNEMTVMGGLKTKNVDVVVTKGSLGPALTISVKGTFHAFRNLTNRMEEAVGDCTNLHITYPAMVAGFISVLRANQAEEVGVIEDEDEDELEEALEEALEEVADDDAPPARQLKANDIAIREGGEPVETIFRYHSALRELTGRRGIRDDVSRYEAVGMALVESNNTDTPGAVLPHFPPENSPLRLENFFQALYLRYDERYVYAAPDLKSTTTRREWSARSPIFTDPEYAEIIANLGYTPRIAD